MIQSDGSADSEGQAALKESVQGAGSHSRPSFAYSPVMWVVLSPLGTITHNQTSLGGSEAACSWRVPCLGAVPATDPAEEVLRELTQESIQVICRGEQRG